MTVIDSGKKRFREAKINIQEERTRPGELAGLFLRLGFTAFGGPAAHIAMMEAEVVRRRSWFTHEEFLDMLGVTNLIPGPSSTEMAIHIGYRRGGVKGLLIAGACFIVPRFRSSALMRGFLDGINAGALGLMTGVCFLLGESALTGLWSAAIAAVALFVQIRWRANAAWIVAGGALAGWATGLP